MFEFKGRKFDFKIPNIFDGNAILDTLTSYKVPFNGDELLRTKTKKPSMSAEKLEEFQKLCLKNCFEDLGTNKAPVVDAQGYFGIILDENSAESIMLINQLTNAFTLFFTERCHAAIS